MFGGYTAQTGFGRNVQLHDYSGRAGDVWTAWQGNVTIGIPPNDNGRGYICYSRAGLDKPNPVHRFATTQVFEGGKISTSGPQSAARRCELGGIWRDAGFPIHLQPDSATSDLTLGVVDIGRAIRLSWKQGETARICADGTLCR